MNRVFLTLALVMALPSLATAQPDPNPPLIVRPPQLKPDTPENAVRYFIQQLQQNYEPSLSVAVAGVPIGFFGSDGWTQALHNGYPFSVLSTAQVKAVNVVAQTQDAATVEVTIRLQTPDANGQMKYGEPQKEALQLRREKFATIPIFDAPIMLWRIVPPSIEDVLAKPLVLTPPLQLEAALLTHDPRLLAAFDPDEGTPQERARHQLKQLGLGAAQFVQDYNTIFAFDDAAYERALRPYLQKDSLYTITGTKDEKWHFNDNLSTLPLDRTKDLSKVVEFYDGTAPDSEHLNFRFDGKTAVCFADGHAATLSKDEARDLVWKP